jgi:hypothetical protein
MATCLLLVVAPNLRKNFLQRLSECGVEKPESLQFFDKWLQILNYRANADNTSKKYCEIIRIDLPRLGTGIQISSQYTESKYYGPSGVCAHIHDKLNSIFVVDKQKVHLFSEMLNDEQQKLRALPYIKSIEVSSFEDIKIINNNDK